MTHPSFQKAGQPPVYPDAAALLPAPYPGWPPFIPGGPQVVPPQYPAEVQAGGLSLFREPLAWTDRFRPYRVEIDGQAVGKLKQGNSFDLQLAPGLHTVQLKVDWTGSPVYSFVVDPGRTTHLACRGDVKPTHALFKMAESFGDGTNWIKLYQQGA